MAPINAALLTQRRRAGVPAWVASGAMAAVVVMGVALVALKPSRSAAQGRGGPVSLLGYDPYTPVSKPGAREDIAGAWGEEGESEKELPHWATDWPADAEAPCEPGQQCVDNVGNPLGVLGKWVMQATTLGDSSRREWNVRHNCVGLPGWAVEECMRMRQEEKKLAKDGTLKEPTAPPAPEGEEGAEPEKEEGAEPEKEEGAKEEPPAAKRSRTTVLAQRGAGRGGGQRGLDAMERRRAVPMQRSSMARGGGFAGGAQAAEEAGEVVVVPARDVRVV